MYAGKSLLMNTSEIQKSPYKQDIVQSQVVSLLRRFDCIYMYTVFALKIRCL